MLDLCDLISAKQVFLLGKQQVVFFSYSVV